MFGFRPVAALTASLLALTAAMPAQADAFNIDHALDNILGRAMEMMPNGVKNVRIGLGPTFEPDFLGDSHKSAGIAPVVSLRYRNIVAVDNNSVRVNVLGSWGNMAGKDSPLSLGPAITVDFGRGEGDSPKLRGLGDIGTSVELGAFVGYNVGTSQFRLRARKDVTGATGGWIVDGNASLSLMETERLLVRGNAQVTWGNADYFGAFFGVTPAQSIASGLPVYRAHSGLHDASLTVSAEYLVSDRWSVLGVAGFTRLFGSAADGPLVKQRGSPNQPSVAAFAIYAF